MQVVRAYVAPFQSRPVPTLSTELLFDDVHRQLVAFTELVPPIQIEPLFPVLPSVEELRAQLTRLLATVWTSRWLKAPPKKRKAPTPRTPIRGNQTSVYRLVAAYNKQRLQFPLIFTAVAPWPPWTTTRPAIGRSGPRRSTCRQSRTCSQLSPPTHVGPQIRKYIQFVVRVRFEPTQVEQAFAPTTYLRELLKFATRWIKIGDSPEGPTPQTLAQRFFQPFDKLTVGEHYEQAAWPVHPARLAVEVLHQQLAAGVPPAIDKRFRFAAYEVIVRELGTSYEELRLARVADPETRRALAAQIGIDIEGPRPDLLDQITLLPATVTHTKLEELFGYRSTASTDPLQPPGAGPRVLTSRFSAVRSAWQRDDARSRDGADGPLPVIDPDLISQENIAAQQASNPAFDLWTKRKHWIDTTLDDIVDDAETQTNPLARFDQVVLTWVGNIDLAALAVRDANGEDITRDLEPFKVSLEAFRFLARCRELLVVGTLLESEWQDIFAILLQTQKQLQYGQWRAEEREAGVVLEPGQFLAEAGMAAPDIPPLAGFPRNILAMAPDSADTCGAAKDRRDQLLGGRGCRRSADLARTQGRGDRTHRTATADPGGL